MLSECTSLLQRLKMFKKYNTYPFNVCLHFGLHYVVSYFNFRGEHPKISKAFNETNYFQQSFESDMVSCVFLVILLHYFHLTTFFWMFVEGNLD